MNRSIRSASKGLLALFAVALVAVVLSSPAFAEDKPLGQQVFEAQKCNLCHAVSSANIQAKMKVEKMKGPDMVGVGSRHESDWLTKYIRKDVQLNDKDHKKEFKGTDEDLKAMVDWLVEQK